MRHALVRGLPDSYVHATRGEADGPVEPIDVELARAQHGRIVAALRDLGVTVHRVAASEAHPDCVFIEDTAVVAAGRAVMLRSAHPGRRGEGPPVAAALLELGLDVVELTDGTCDGGDVLRVEDRLWIGLSARTDAAGAEALARALHPVGVRARVVQTPGGLHLKCFCSSPAHGLVLAAEGHVDPAWFEGVPVVWTPAEEAYAANAVGSGGRVLVAAGFPRTAAALSAAGLTPVEVDGSELRKGDGSLTCLSLRW